jgi:hypothetical protein
MKHVPYLHRCTEKAYPQTAGSAFSPSRPPGLRVLTLRADCSLFTLKAAHSSCLLPRVWEPLTTLPVGVHDRISGRNDTKCVSKGTVASSRSMRATAPRMGTGFPSMSQKLSLVSTCCATKTPQRFSDEKRQELRQKWRLLSQEKTRHVTLRRPDTLCVRGVFSLCLLTQQLAAFGDVNYVGETTLIVTINKVFPYDWYNEIGYHDFSALWPGICPGVDACHRVSSRVRLKRDVACTGGERPYATLCTYYPVVSDAGMGEYGVCPSETRRSDNTLWVFLLTTRL